MLLRGLADGLHPRAGQGFHLGGGAGGVHQHLQVVVTVGAVGRAAHGPDAADRARTESVGAHVRPDETPRMSAVSPAEGPETAAERTDPWSSITAAAQKESAAC